MEKAVPPDFISFDRKPHFSQLLAIMTTSLKYGISEYCQE